MAIGCLSPAVQAGVMDCVMRRLDWCSNLMAADQGRLSVLAGVMESYTPRSTIIPVNARRRALRFVVSGWACQQRTLPDGRRQIFNLFLPGDVIGLHEFFGNAALCDTVALTRVVTVDASSLVGGDAISPTIAAAFARENISRESLLLDHLMRLGRQTARERTAHLFLELRSRLSIVGHGSDSRFPLPLTQETLSDILGTSTVHLSRTLQQLRRERLANVDGGFVDVLDAMQLSIVADYSPPTDSEMASKH